MSDAPKPADYKAGPDLPEPVVAADKNIPEFSIKAIVLGSIIGVLFGAANVYLALNVGLTVSASIPAAVIAVAILRGVFRSGTILESNMVQTVGSAGESLAAGIVFTLPALIIWGMDPSLFTIFIVALLGGLLGVLMMVPLRRYLIVEEHDKLPYPEGTACAEVLVAGEEGGVKGRRVFQGLGIGALYTFLMKGLGLWSDSPHFKIPRMKSMEVGVDTLPALLGVGYIIGPRIAGLMLAGGVMGWLVIIPVIHFFGSGIPEPLFPAQKSLIAYMSPGDIWNNYIRYIGAGAVAAGGLISLAKSLPTIWNSFKKTVGKFTAKASQVELRTERDLSPKFVLPALLVIGILIWAIPQVPVGLLGTVLILVFSFFFVTVSSRIVGLIGSSSNPASGMTIATLLLVTLIFSWAGYSGEAGKIAAIMAGSLVCIGICIAGDTSQDLKTGFLVGATPYKQQIGELIGVAVAAIFIGLTLFVLNEGYGIGPAPEKIKPAQMQDMRQHAGAFSNPATLEKVVKAIDEEIAEAKSDELPFDKDDFAAFATAKKLEVYEAYRNGAGADSKEHKRLKAPQATLMSMVIEGVMDANLPWVLIFIGAFAAIVVELLGAPSLPFAVGLYLPLSLSTPIIIGGVVRGLIDRKRDKKIADTMRENGILFSSGLIAGEALVGISLAVLAWQKISISFASGWMGSFETTGSLMAFGLLVALLFWFLRPTKEQV